MTSGVLHHSSVFLSQINPKYGKSGENPQNKDSHNRITDNHTKHIKNLISAKYFFYQRNICKSKVNNRLYSLNDTITHCR